MCRGSFKKLIRAAVLHSRVARNVRIRAKDRDDDHQSFNEPPAMYVRSMPTVSVRHGRSMDVALHPPPMNDWMAQVFIFVNR